jgi:hypothetical protein
MIYLMPAFHQTELYTLSLLMDEDEEFICFICQDAQRLTKVPGQTRIPAGTYELILEHSPKMSPVYGHPMVTLVGVANYTAVRMHSGVSEADTEGCPLVGYGATTNPKAMSRLVNSRACYDERFYPRTAASIKAEKTFLKVIDSARGPVLR